MSLPPPSECGSEACWGVIVEKNGGVFARVKEPSREEAEAGALTLCARRLGATGCRVLAVVSKKECWALAEMATDRSKWKAAPGVTLDEAKLLASNECERIRHLPGRHDLLRRRQPSRRWHGLARVSDGTDGHCVRLLWGDVIYVAAQPQTGRHGGGLRLSTPSACG